jgi:hypothetical protein
MTLASVIEQLWDIERTHGLFDLEFHGVKIWQVVRTPIVAEALRRHVHGDAVGKPDRDLERIKMLKAAAQVPWHYVQGFRRRPAHTSILVLQHPRRVLEAGSFVDIYTDPVLAHLNDYTAFEPYHKLAHAKPPKTSNVVYLDHLEFPCRFAEKFQPVRLDGKDGRALENLTSVVGICLDLDPKWIRWTIKRELARLLYLLPRVDSIVSQIAPKLILEVVWYNRMNRVFNLVAKRRGIPILELQHGTMGSYHHGYAFPEVSAPDVLPDFVAVWGEFWKKTSRLPLPPDHLVVTGFPRLAGQPLVRTSVSDGRKHVLVLSQGTIGRRLAEIVKDVAQRPGMGGVTFHFKTHPSEESLVDEKYGALQAVPNIRVVRGREGTPLEQLFAMSHWQIGVYSTALVEGIRYGLRTIVVRLPGWEYYQSLGGTPGMSFVDTVDELAAMLERPETPGSEESSQLTHVMWAPDAMSRTLALIKDLMSA